MTEPLYAIAFVRAAPPQMVCGGACYRTKRTDLEHSRVNCAVFGFQPHSWISLMVQLTGEIRPIQTSIPPSQRERMSQFCASSPLLLGGFAAAGDTLNPA